MGIQPSSVRAVARERRPRSTSAVVQRLSPQPEIQISWHSFIRPRLSTRARSTDLSQRTTIRNKLQMQRSKPNLSILRKLSRPAWALAFACLSTLLTQSPALANGYYNDTFANCSTKELNGCRTPAWTSLTSYWKFEEPFSATSAIDSEGSISGTPQGSLTFGSVGKLFNSIHLNGSTMYVSFGNNFNYTSQSFTIMHWVYFNSLSTNQAGQGPITFYKGGYNANGCYSQINSAA